MQEYKEKFIWNKFIEKMKKDMKEKVNKINKEISEMIIDSSEEENGNVMLKYNSLYNANFLNIINMILED
jgi:hypothetical protein